MFGSVEWCNQTFLDAIAYEAIGLFDFPICLRVRNGCEVELDAQAFAVILEFFGLEVCDIVYDDATGHSKAEDGGFDEIHHCG
jgi:hypothetical protein